MSAARAGALLMVASAAAWAFGTIASKAVLDASGAAPASVLTVQLTASVCVLVVVARISRQAITPAWRDGWTGLLEPGLAYLLGLAGLARTSAATATVLGSLEPVAVPLLVWVLWRQAPGRLRFGLTALATAGAIGVSWVGVSEGRSVAGDALVLAGVFAAALYAVVSARSVERHGVAALAACQQAVALAAIAAVSVGQSLLADASWPSDPAHLAAAAGSGVLNYALPFGLYLLALRRLPLTSAAGYLSLIPVFGMAGSVALLGERVTLVQVAAAVLVVAALVTLSRVDGDTRGPAANSPDAHEAPSTMRARSAA